MATTPEECDDMINASNKDVKLMIGLMKRFNNGLQKVKEVVDSRRIDKHFYVYVHHTMSEL